MYDIAVIGAGWAGFNASLAAKSKGLKVALIDKGPIGGTCLNLGCIPTKTLIQSARVYSQINKARKFGIEVSAPAKIDWQAILSRKNRIIEQLRQGMEFRLKGVDFFNSQAKINTCDTIELKDSTIKSRFIIIATGSEPLGIKGIEFSQENIIFSDQVLSLKEIPKNILIIGGGVIGCEFASLFNLLGSEVSVFEIMSQLLPGEDQELARKLESNFKKRGIVVNTQANTANIDFKAYDRVLICVGRKPKTDHLGLDNLKMKLERNRIVTDEFLKTNVPNIYAAGDCTSNIMLAHYAAYQGRLAVYNINSCEEPRKLFQENVPNCIFTEPEIASIGLTESSARDKGIDIRVDKFDFLASGMARIIEETEGFIKIISDKTSQQILGACIIGPKASELIGILTLGIQKKLKTTEISDLILAHPTLSEAIRDIFN